ncbi:flagellar motor switch protein FliG [Pseudarthrobacter sp. NBSH8]|uniref:flagellar motor switch protein FliG n=1 Tax=Pseudarthrobacter sp. NBSH8 TaxID=2596911 RepID=UPI001629BC7B|nr:flagellar motor switch protein FliG [Pseudarthrobacter sp. NBSH8]QNE15622.1 flagellar motor switch protein FliG [Pseudarthrobacter sp. NBSH8]
MTVEQLESEAPALTGAQKVAVVLMQMSPTNAAAVMAQFSETEAEDIAAEIVRLRRVSSVVADKVISEFHEFALSGRRSARGGRELAVGLLEASFGADKAASFMDRLASTMAGKSFEFLEMMLPSQLLELIDGELPQTIALLLAHLRPSKASALMAALGDAQRTEVARCIATMGSVAPETVSIVAETLKQRAGAVATQAKSTEVVGGIQPLVDIINRADVTTERSVLEGLEALYPELAADVRARMLTFGDIVKLERRDIQQILRGVAPEVLAIAMKGAPAVVLDAVRSNVSGRNQEILEAEMASSGPVRASQIEEARADIVRSIRELEANGAIVVRRGEEDTLVY